MFRDSRAHLQEDTVIHMQHMVLSLCKQVSGRVLLYESSWWLVGTQLCNYKPPETLIESDCTICCMCTTVSSWR